MALTTSTVGIDIGGHGVVAAMVHLNPLSATVEERHESSPRSIDELAAWLTDTFGRIGTIGVSSAGFVEDGDVTLCRVQPWLEGRTTRRLEEALGGRTTVRIVNDGDAHALAAGHAHQRSGDHPLLAFSIGTSVGFGVIDARGHLARPLAARNWDIGSMRVRTGASTPEVWWACGSKGLAELETARGTADAVTHFGYRIGGLVTDFSILFQPNTVVLSGGIPAKFGDRFLSAVQQEVSTAMPNHTKAPRIAISEYGRSAGIVGAAVAGTANS